MQTRKRAKSITFGKPKKEEEVKPKATEEEKVVAPVEEKPKEKEEPKKVEEPKVISDSDEPTEAAKKVIALEESEKELSSDLSATPSTEEPALSDKPETPEEKEKEEDVISADNFVIDTEATKVVDDKAEDDKASESSTTDVLSPVVEPETESKLEGSELSSNDQELSPTPPPSAFSIQEDGDDTSEPGGKKRHFLVYFLVIALFSFILGLGAMAVLSSGILPGVSIPKELPFVSEIGKSVQQTVSQPTVAPTTAMVSPTVAPTEKPVDLSAYTVSVLNGSGIKGKAAEVKTSLTTAGFKIGTTGNAAKSDFTETEITAKKDVEQAYIDKLKVELEKDFVVKVVSAPAPASQATDVIVTIGSEAK